jgi:hypothetical protein
MTRFFTFLAGILIFFATGAGALSEAEMESRLKDLFNQFRCPTCQGLSVKDSEAGFSVQIRNKIKDMLQSGATDDEIRAYLLNVMANGFCAVHPGRVLTCCCGSCRDWQWRLGLFSYFIKAGSGQKNKRMNCRKTFH